MNNSSAFWFVSPALSSKAMHLNSLDNLDKDKSFFSQELIDNNLTAQYNAEQVFEENKKPELGGSGKKCADRQRRGNRSLSPDLIYEKEKVMKDGFFLHRVAEQLLQNDPDAYLLLSQIAFRARKAASLFDRELTVNQAKIGDYENCGLTRQRYRDALGRLVRKYAIITIKTTNKGTIATLLNTDVCDINPMIDNQQVNHQRTNKEPLNSNNISSLRSDISLSDDSKISEKTPKSKKRETSKKTDATPDELKLRNERKTVIDIAIKNGFPFSPAEINKQIKTHCIEAVKVTVNLFVNGEFENVQSQHLKGAIYRRIETEHAYIQEFNTNE